MLVVLAVSAALAPGASASGGNAAAGKSVFQSNCASCHTLKAAGSVGTIGPNLDKTSLSETTIVKAVTSGGASVMTKAAAAKYQIQMTAYKGTLTPTQIADVSAFVYASTHATTTQAKVTVTVTIGVPKATSCKLSKSVVAKGTVVFTVKNEGKTKHFFEVDGKKTPLIAAHKSAKLTVVFGKTGRFTYTCVAKGTLKVT